MDHVEQTTEKPIHCPECDDETPHVVREGVAARWIEYTEGECQRCGYTSRVCTGTIDHFAPELA